MSIFDIAKNIGSAVYHGLGTMATSAYNSAKDFAKGIKKQVVRSAMENFGPSFAEEGADILKEHIEKKVGNSFKDILSFISPAKILKQGNKSLKKQFIGLLDQAEQYLDEQYNKTDKPLDRTTYDLASRLIAQGRILAEGFSKLTAKSIKQFQKDIELAQPKLQEEIGSYFMKYFIYPILSFLADLLKSFTKEDEPELENKEAKNETKAPEAKQNETDSDSDDDEFEDVYEDENEKSFRM